MKNSSDLPLRLNLSVDETAAALKVSPRTVRSFLARGELPSMRIGRRRLIPWRALQKWVSDRTEASS